MNIKKQLAGIVTVAAAAIMLMALCACGAKDINVNIKDGTTTTQATAQEGKTVNDFLLAAGITPKDGDEIDPALDTKVTEDGTTITIKHLAKVKVVADDETKEVELTGATAKDALEKAGITLGEGDTVDIDMDKYLEDGMTITVTRAIIETPEEPEVSSGGSYDNDDDSDYQPAGRTVVSKTRVPNCNDANHGYYEIQYSDGSMEYEEY